MRNHDTRTESERASQDFWDWFGAKLDADEAVKATMPARDESTRTILGEEMLDIEFEPIAQVFHLDDYRPRVEAQGPVLSDR